MKNSSVRLIVSSVLLGALIWVIFQGLGSVRPWNTEPPPEPPVPEQLEETIVLVVDRLGEGGWVVRVDDRQISDEDALTTWLKTQDAQNVLILTRGVDDAKSVGEVIAACRHADKAGERKPWVEPPGEDE